jgi:hypothetical protein
LLLELLFNFLSLCLILLVILFEVFLVPFQDLIALLESLRPLFSLTRKIFNLFFNDAVSHRHQEHLLLLLKNLHDGLVFSDEVFVLLSHLDYLKSTFNQFFLFLIKGVDRNVFVVYSCLVIIESLQFRAARRSLLVPYFHVPLFLYRIIATMGVCSC